MITVTVTVVSPGNADITVSPTLANVNRGDLVQWLLTNSNGTRLKLNFTTPDGTPFSSNVLNPGGTAVEAGILSTANQQSYHYGLVAT
ncbi:MAG TPA: hypothetical protein VFV14_00895, partial [Myxococcaceae bacterium]|nr:hypothetical protein [Myxococcaceae bacterium]